MKIRLNDIELTLPTGQRLTELLAVQEIAPQGVAVALNGAVLFKGEEIGRAHV